MSDMTIQNAIHCMKAMICEAVCEECDYYGKTGTDHCEADAVRMAIEALSCSEKPNRSDTIYRQDAIDAIDKAIRIEDSWIKTGLRMAKVRIADLPSAHPDLLEDGTLLTTVPQGMLEKVKRVMVDEVGTKFCKTMYQDEPERKKGRWIDQDDGAFYPVECSECRKIPLFDVDGDYALSNFCPNCGAEMEGEEHETD